MEIPSESTGRNVSGSLDFEEPTNSERKRGLLLTQPKDHEMKV